MAEALGVVASGIALGQAAKGLAKAISHMKQLWADVKDVPETIEDLLDELELTAMVLAAMEEKPTTSTCPATSDSISSLQRQAIEWCRKIHSDMENLILDLASDIESTKMTKRAVAKARVALKKDVIKGYERRLKKAHRFLDTAFLLYRE
jgi:hypothetical protein